MARGKDTRFHPARVIQKPSPPAGYGKYKESESMMKNGDVDPQREADRKFDQQEYERKQAQNN